MGIVLLYTYFLANVALVVVGVTYFVRLARGVAVLGGHGMPTPKWLYVFIFCLGCLGVVSSAPSIFFTKVSCGRERNSARLDGIVPV